MKVSIWRQAVSLLAMWGLLAVSTITIIGCQPIEKSARDTIAAATGAIQSAQVEYKAECLASPSSGKCVLINQAVYAQNAAITALEAYCGFQVGVTVPQETCKPTKTVASALNATLANLSNFTNEIMAVLRVGKTGAGIDRMRDVEATVLINSHHVATYAELESVRARADVPAKEGM